MLYELYTGAPPFRGNRPFAVMMQHINIQPTPPDLVNPGVSPIVTQIILRCLAKDPQQRFPNAASLAVALANALHVPVSEELRHGSVLSGVTLSAPSSPRLPGTPLRFFPATVKRKRRSRSLVLAAVVSLILLLGAGFGTLLLTTQKNAPIAAQGTGNAFFLNSDSLSASSTQGINDELEIDLANIPAPAAGKSYYAWLLGDSDQTEVMPILLGRVTVVHGSVHFLYRGDTQQSNLLAFASRFLITEDDARNPSSDPLLDQRSWRYYAALPQTPNPVDTLHFTMLDHLRHLLVESPELTARGLHGGLAYWFARNTATVSNLASGLAADWQRKDANTIHAQVIRILDYLDGASFVQTDVPHGTPLLADARSVQVALLGPVPQNASPPGYVYQSEAPPGYVYLVQTHLNGAVLSPQATTAQRQLAIQANKNLDNVKSLLTRVYQDARQLVGLTDAQLLQPPTLGILDDMATQAQFAYTGPIGTMRGGVTGIYNDLQQLATFVVTPFSAG